MTNNSILTSFSGRTLIMSILGKEKKAIVKATVSGIRSSSIAMYSPVLVL